MMETCILLGNGINLCTFDPKDIDWSQLIKRIKEDYGVGNCNCLSYSMQFETLVNQIFSKQESIKYENIKEDIAKHLNSIDKTCLNDENNLHRLFVDKADSILTTNYEFFLEESLGMAFNKKYLKHNTICNLNSFTLVNGNKRIYHIHGNLEHYKTICLGYEHYAKTLQMLRNTIASRNRKNKKPKIINYLDNSTKYELNTWATKFFTDNVHIVGLGLSREEIDLWWLITYRASLCYSNEEEYSNKIKNTITYHHVYSDNIENSSSSKQMKYILENLNVKYKSYLVKDDDYKAQYKKIAEAITN